MRRGGAAALALFAALVSCASREEAPAATGVAVALRNPGFEATPDANRPCATGWACTMHADPSSFRFFHDERAPAAGARSFCIEPSGNEPWALATQGIHDPPFRGARVRFSIAVRTEGVTGDGAGPSILIQSHARAPLNARKLVKGTSRWQRVAVEIDVPAQAQIVEVGLALDGRGRVCFDDARLEVLAGAKSPV